MAFRIHDNVVRGEIDNRVKGVVRGRIWVGNRREPVVLELKGNAHPDLAGSLLTFENPLPVIPHEHLDGLNPLQKGTIGDLTASRKVRVFDIPLEEAHAMIKRGEKPPEHMANCLYLEWFSTANGRVVIESADYRLRISPPEWRLSPEGEEMNRICAEADENPPQPNPLTEGVDWVTNEHGQPSHPLEIRIRAAWSGLWHWCDERGLLDAEDSEHLRRMFFKFQSCGAKCAGALGGLAYEEDAREPGFIVAGLKRALALLHESLEAAQRVQTARLLPAEQLDAFFRELFTVRQQILLLMERFRGEAG